MKSAVIAPIVIKARPERATLIATARLPSVNMKAITGKIAPVENNRKDDPAAAQAEPPSSSGSRPSSSRTNVSRAAPWLLKLPSPATA